MADDPGSEVGPTTPEALVGEQTDSRTPRRRRGKGAHRAPSPTRRHRWLRRTAIGLAVVVLLLAGTVGASYWYVRHELGSVKHFGVKETSALKIPPPPNKPEDILLVGSDSRSCIPPSDYAHEGNPTVQSGQRSDVIIVVRLVPATDSVEMLSIPRDTYVPIAGTGGSSLINSAFNTGPNQLIETIEQDFGIPINHVVVANFCGFTDIVNALGGIYLDFPDPATDYYTGLRIKHAGCQLINGVQALQLVRSRHYFYYPQGYIGHYEGGGYFAGGEYDGMSDWSRIRREQAFFHAVLDRAKAEDLNPLAMARLLGAVVKDVTVDSGLTTSDMLSLAVHYRHFGSGQLRTLVLPTVEGYPTAENISPAVPQASQVVAQFLSFGTPRHFPSSTTSTTSGPGSTTGSSTTSTSSTTTTTSPTVPSSTSPPSEVVLDTPQTLPEPWNPTPCSP